MTNVDASTFGRARSAFALSAAITILLNTVVACTKDAYSPLKLFMASLTGQDLTSQGLADVVVFVGLGLILLEASFAEKINPTPVISFLVGAVTVAGEDCSPGTFSTDDH
jgi:hypothetical protein